MKFNDILMAIDNNTKIRVTITQYGMKFSTSYHYGEYFLDNKELDELTERRVLDGSLCCWHTARWQDH